MTLMLFGKQFIKHRLQEPDQFFGGQFVHQGNHSGEPLHARTTIPEWVVFMMPVADDALDFRCRYWVHGSAFDLLKLMANLL